jgi:hypothetical protein
VSRFRQNATCVASRDPQAAQTAAHFCQNGPTEWAYSPTVKPQQQESSRGRDERPAHSYDDISPATGAGTATAHLDSRRDTDASSMRNSVRPDESPATRQVRLHQHGRGASAISPAIDANRYPRCRPLRGGRECVRAASSDAFQVLHGITEPMGVSTAARCSSGRGATGRGRSRGRGARARRGRAAVPARRRHPSGRPRR